MLISLYSSPSTIFSVMAHGLGKRNEDLINLIRDSAQTSHSSNLSFYLPPFSSRIFRILSYRRCREGDGFGEYQLSAPAEGCLSLDICWSQLSLHLLDRILMPRPSHKPALCASYSTIGILERQRDNPDIWSTSSSRTETGIPLLSTPSLWKRWTQTD